MKRDLHCGQVHPSRRILSADDVRGILSDWMHGESQASLAARHHVSERTIRRALFGARQQRAKPLDAALVAKISKHMREGASQRRCARELAISRRIVARVLGLRWAGGSEGVDS